MLVCEMFSAAKLPEVQGFYCGDDPWETIVADFLKGNSGGDPKSITLINQRRAEVWMYKHDTSGALVGFGALTKQKWTIDSVEEKVTLLHAFGVQKEFQGQPPGPSNQRYATLMLSDLLAKAVGYNRPIWGLFVHKDNLRAKTFYERAGFVKIEEVRNTYERMFMKIL